jgi:hypothetical protein
MATLELCTVSGVVAWTGASTTNATIIAQAVERRIANYCGRRTEDGDDTWGRVERTEYLDGELSDGVLLKWTPIDAVSSVRLITGSGTGSGSETYTDVDLTSLAVDGVAIPDLGTAGLAAQKGLLHYRGSSTGMWDSEFIYARRSRVPVSNFGSGRYRVRVVYTGGYGSPAKPIPDDLKAAALILAKNMNDARSVSSTLQSETLGNYSYTNSSSSDAVANENMMGGVKDLLQPYRSYANIV